MEMPATHPPRSTIWDQLPTELEILWFSSGRRSVAWLANALSADRATKIRLSTATDVRSGIEQLRSSCYHVVLVEHDPPHCSAFPLLQPIYAAAGDQPALLVFGSEPLPEVGPLVYELGGDGYVSVPTCTTQGLIWEIARAVERHQLLAENRRLRTEKVTLRRQEKNSVQQFLDQQRSIAPVLRTSDPVEKQLGEAYTQLLRTHVIMGTGSLPNEVQAIAQKAIRHRLPATHMVRLHNQIVAEMTKSLGSRGARHLLDRSELVLTLLLIQLADKNLASLDSLFSPKSA